MNSFIRQNHRLLFFGAWFIVNIIQSAFTGLFDDEAYYWIYSQFPAWGYFDHPPMIAWLIKAGGFLFSGELGVRFFIVVLNTASFFIIHQLIRRKDDYLFYLITGTLAVAQIGGMIAVPDLPLLFFISLYFLIYRRFAEEQSLLNTTLLAISVSLMMYSKYHGVLIVFATLLSNPVLFRKPKTYVVAIIALLLFAPHLYWQYTHDFPSVQYHLFERNASSYRVSFTLEYISGQLLLAGPVAGWLLLWAAFRYRPTDKIEKALKYSMVIFYLFFLVSTLKGRVEANWTIPAFIALIILSHQFLIKKPGWRKPLKYMALATIVLVFIGRIYMMIDIPPSKIVGKDEFHQNRNWTGEISDTALGLNVVMLNSYQKPSKFWYYTGEPSLAFNTTNYRRNNFNYWPVEDSFMNKPALVVGAYDPLVFKIPFKHPTIAENGALRVPNYFSFTRIRFTEISESENQISIKAETPEHYLPFLQKFPMDTASIYLAIYEEGKEIQYHPTGIKLNSISEPNQSFSFPKPPAFSGDKQTGKLAITSCLPGHLSLNSVGF